jgi:protein translocase SEC61 complex gamma subunit
MNLKFDPIAAVRNFYEDAKHVASVSYKPDTDTFKRTLKVVLVGILILGVLGFAISFIINGIALTPP